jgi:hypothetical protein
MANVKYLVTVDAETGAPTRLEFIGEDGDTTEMDVNKITCDCGGVSIVVNVYGGAKGEAKPPERINPVCRFPQPPRPK